MSSSTSNSKPKTPDFSRNFGNKKYYRRDNPCRTLEGNTTNQQENRGTQQPKHHNQGPSNRLSDLHTSSDNGSRQGYKPLIQSPSPNKRHTLEDSSTNKQENRGFYPTKHRDQRPSNHCSGSRTLSDNISSNGYKPCTQSLHSGQAPQDQPPTSQVHETISKQFPSLKISGSGRGKFIQNVLQMSAAARSSSVLPTSLSAGCANTTSCAFDKHLLGESPLRSVAVTDEGLLITTLHNVPGILSKSTPVSFSYSSSFTSSQLPSNNHAKALSVPDSNLRSNIKRPSELFNHESKDSIPSNSNLLLPGQHNSNSNAIKSILNKIKTNQFAANSGLNSSKDVTSTVEATFSSTQTIVSIESKPTNISEIENVNKKHNNCNPSTCGGSATKNKTSPYSLLVRLKKSKSSLTENSFHLKEKTPSVLRTPNVSCDQRYSDHTDATSSSAYLNHRFTQKISNLPSNDKNLTETVKQTPSPSPKVSKISSLRARSFNQDENCTHEDINASPTRCSNCSLNNNEVKSGLISKADFKNKTNPHFLLAKMKKSKSSLTENSSYFLRSDLKEKTPSVLRTSNASCDQRYSDRTYAASSSAHSNHRFTQKISNLPSNVKNVTDTVKQTPSPSPTGGKISSLRAHGSRSSFNQDEHCVHEDINASPIRYSNSSLNNNEVESGLISKTDFKNRTSPHSLLAKMKKSKSSLTENSSYFLSSDLKEKTPSVSRTFNASSDKSNSDRTDAASPSAHLNYRFSKKIWNQPGNDRSSTEAVKQSPSLIPTVSGISSHRKHESRSSFYQDKLCTHEDFNAAPTRYSNFSLNNNKVESGQILKTGFKNKTGPNFLLAKMKKSKSSLTENSSYFRSHLNKNTPSVSLTSNVSSDKSNSDRSDAACSVAHLNNRAPKEIPNSPCNNSSVAEKVKQVSSPKPTVSRISPPRAHESRSSFNQDKICPHQDINSSPIENSNSLSNNKEVELSSSGHNSAVETSVLKSDGPKSSAKRFSVHQKDQIEFSNPQFIKYYNARTKQISGILHGFADIQPVTTIHEVEFHPSLLERLVEMGANDLTRCQMYGLPVVASGRNFVMVAPPNSGRTTTCSLSVISQLLYPEKHSQLPDGCGPRAVFLTTTSEKVRELGTSFSQFRRGLSVLTAHGGGLENEVKGSLTNGCDILVTTARCWLRLLNYETVTNVKRLCHLVMDNFEAQLDLFTPEITNILKLIKKLNLTREKNNINPLVQVVAVSEKWSSELDELLIKNSQTALHQPIVGFTVFYEAAIYAGIKPVVHVLTCDALRQRLKKEVMAHADKCGVIVCKNDAEVKELWIELAPIRKNLLVAHSEMHNCLLKEALVEWNSRVERPNSDSKSDCPPLLLVSDLVLDDLYIQNAQWLFHYSLPDSKKYLNSRFATIKGLLNDRIKDPEAALPNCTVEICITDTNHVQLLFVVSLLERLKISFPARIISLLPVLKMQKESKKSHANFCKRLLQFGKCWRELDHCGSQHIVNPSRDAPKLPVKNGFIKIDILHVLDASHFSARILGFSSTGVASGNFTPSDSSNDYLLIAYKMSSYFRIKKNRLPHEDVKVGDMVAVEVNTDTLFRRARVIKIKNKIEKVRILHVDHGLREYRNPTDLLALPEDLQNYPDVAVDVYLSQLFPIDLDVTWSYAANNLVRRQIGRLEKYNFIGEIQLVLGKNILVDNLKCFNYLPQSETNVCQLNLRKLLFNHKLAVNNPDHLNSLYDLSVKAGIDPPQCKTVTRSVVKKDSTTSLQPNWAFLTLEEINEVELVVTASPALFFVKLTTFRDCLTALHNDLEAAVTNGECNSVSNSSCVEVNSYWIVLKETTWNRVVVLNLPSNNLVEVLFVDFGDTAEVPIDQLRSIPRRLIMQLPFQAIECSLVGVQPVDDEWNNAAYKYFDDQAQIYSYFYVKVCEKQHAMLTGGRHYSVVLYGTVSDPKEHIVINQEMISKGLANAGKTSHYLNSVFNLRKAEDLRASSSEDEAMDDKPAELEDLPDNVLSNNTKTLPLNIGNIDELEIVGAENGENLFKLEQSITNVFWNFFTSKYRPNELEFKKTSDHNDKGITNNNTTVISRESKNDVDILEECKDERSSPTLSIQMAVPWHLCLPSGTVEPYIHWRQYSQSICLRILILDLKSDNVGFEWSSSHLMFMALKDDRRYFFKIDLFGPIDPDTIVFNLTGQCYEVILEKMRKNFSWPRLTSDDNKYLFIKPDPDHVKVSKVKKVLERIYNKGQRRLDHSGTVGLTGGTRVAPTDKHHDTESSDLNSEDSE